MTISNIKEIKKAIIKTGKKLYKKGFTPGMAGNISFRKDDCILITATSVCLGEMNEKDIISIDYNGNPTEKTTVNPSSESLMHVEIYKKRPEINAVIHTHPVFCTTLAVNKEYKFLPIMAEPVILLGEVPVAKYRTPSSKALAQEVACHFAENNAVLMSNHGAVVCGLSLKEAFYKTETLEFYSQVYILSGLSNKRTLISDNKVQELIRMRH